MPFLSRNKLRVEVAFGAASFITGQTLHGTLKLRVLEPVSLHALRVTHIVVEQVRPMTKREARAKAVAEDQRIVYDRKSHENQIFLVGSPAPAAHPFAVGEYTFPFVLDIPANLAPSMGLTRLGPKRIGALVQHTLRVDANITNALFDFNESFPVRVVNACPEETYRGAQPLTVGQHAPAHSFMTVSPAFANTFPSATYAAEQSEFRINVHRPVVSLADDGYIAFRVEGMIPCRYEVRLHRVCTVQIKRRNKTLDSVVSKTVMPPLPVHSVADGVIPLDAHKLMGLTNMSGQRLASVEHYVSVHLLYDRGVCVDVDDKLRAKVPVVLVPSLYKRGETTPALFHAAAVAGEEEPLGKPCAAATYGAVDSNAAPVMGHVLRAPACTPCSA